MNGGVLGRNKNLCAKFSPVGMYNLQLGEIDKKNMDKK